MLFGYSPARQCAELPPKAATGSRTFYPADQRTSHRTGDQQRSDPRPPYERCPHQQTEDAAGPGPDACSGLGHITCGDEGVDLPLALKILGEYRNLCDREATLV